MKQKRKKKTQERCEIIVEREGLIAERIEAGRKFAVCTGVKRGSRGVQPWRYVAAFKTIGPAERLYNAPQVRTCPEGRALIELDSKRLFIVEKVAR